MPTVEGFLNQRRTAGLGGDGWRIVAVAAPLYLSMIAASVGSMVVTAALGRFDTAALAAFALASAVHVPTTAAVTGAVRGVLPFVSSAAHDRDGVLCVVRDGTWLAVAVGVPGAVAVSGVPLLARVGGVPAETVAELGVLPLLLAGSVLLGSVGAMASSSLVGLGRTRTVMRAGLVAATCAAGLSSLLVNGFGPVPALGLAGAGTAVLVANLAACAMNLSGLRSTLGNPLAGLVTVRPDPRRVRELATVGIPMAGTVLVKFGVLGLLAFAAARISPPATAAHGIATSLVGLIFTAAVAVGQAGVPLVSSRATAGDLPGARRGVRAGLVVTTATVGASGALLVILRPVFLPLFTDDPVVRSLTTVLVPVVALAVLGDGLQAVLGFGLTGLRRTAPSFVVFSVAYGILALVALPVASATGIVGLWIALVVTNALVALGQGTAFLRVSGRLGAAAETR
ncbi:multidrug resistance protein, MATE family [Micromonospora echinospora]|uniref:Probable multidrug resistance protein NorM n=1 Tax=Micromonospora echinospora TaxID=1877 RepID=A0A1C4Z7R6_MICEC|nr:MATE family efflux transporter [Micromonospora echinospora]SCF29022.1 multidrug resistance protein, MATE family [Micromonospora echinospora]